VKVVKTCKPSFLVGTFVAVMFTVGACSVDSWCKSTLKQGEEDILNCVREARAQARADRISVELIAALEDSLVTWKARHMKYVGSMSSEIASVEPFVCYNDRRDSALLFVIMVQKDTFRSFDQIKFVSAILVQANWRLYLAGGPVIDYGLESFTSKIDSALIRDPYTRLRFLSSQLDTLVTKWYFDGPNCSSTGKIFNMAGRRTDLIHLDSIWRKDTTSWKK